VESTVDKGSNFIIKFKKINRWRYL
jgi:hypothetical protein